MDSIGPETGKMTGKTIEYLPDNINELSIPAREILEKLESYQPVKGERSPGYQMIIEVVRRLVELEEWAYGASGAVSNFHRRLNILEDKEERTARRVGTLESKRGFWAKVFPFLADKNNKGGAEDGKAEAGKTGTDDSCDLVARKEAAK